jgi:GT2 family glycosyltransferase
MKICLSVLAYNGQPYLRRCLESLARQRVEGGEILIRVLDNASTDGSWELLQSLRERLPNLIIERSPRNLGFSAGHNAALRAGGYDYIGLVNQDCWLEDERAVARLVEASRALNDQVILQPLIRDSERKRAWAGLSVSYTGVALPRPYCGEQIEPFEVPAIHAVLMFTSKTVIEKVGWLEESYFAYHEDLEYSMRAKLLGVGCWCVPASEALHEQEPEKFQANRTGRRLMERNRWRYLASYFSWPLLIALSPALIMQEIGMLAFFAACGDWTGKWLAWGENLLGFREVLALRRACRQRFLTRSEERRVGKECRRLCRSRWSPYH